MWYYPKITSQNNLQNDMNKFDVLDENNVVQAIKSVKTLFQMFFQTHSTVQLWVISIAMLCPG